MDKMKRKSWMGLASASIQRIRNSAHDLDKEVTLDEFLKELKSVIQVYLMEVST